MTASQLASEVATVTDADAGAMRVHIKDAHDRDTLDCTALTGVVTPPEVSREYAASQHPQSDKDSA